MRREVVMRIWICAFILTGLTAPVSAQTTPPARLGEGRGDLLLNELRSAPRPKPATDIDTLRLASAQRERATSVEERTNGLWQSWLVSICEGCGDTASYRKTVGDDFIKRKGLYLARSEGRALRRQALLASTRTPRGTGRSLYADLSPRNIGQIRRMPGP